MFDNWPVWDQKYRLFFLLRILPQGPGVLDRLPARETCSSAPPRAGGTHSCQKDHPMALSARVTHEHCSEPNRQPRQCPAEQGLWVYWEIGWQLLLRGTGRKGAGGRAQRVEKVQDSDFRCSSGKWQSTTSCSPCKISTNWDLTGIFGALDCVTVQVVYKSEGRKLFQPRFAGNSLQDFLAHVSERRAERSHSNNKGPVKMLCSDTSSKGNSHSAHIR